MWVEPCWFRSCLEMCGQCCRAEPLWKNVKEPVWPAGQTHLLVPRLLLSHPPLCFLHLHTWEQNIMVALHPVQRTWNSSHTTLKRTEMQTKPKTYIRSNWNVLFPVCSGAEELHLSCKVEKQHWSVTAWLNTAYRKGSENKLHCPLLEFTTDSFVILMVWIDLFLNVLAEAVIETNETGYSTYLTWYGSSVTPSKVGQNMRHNPPW